MILQILALGGVIAVSFYERNWLMLALSFVAMGNTFHLHVIDQRLKKANIPQATETRVVIQQVQDREKGTYGSNKGTY